MRTAMQNLHERWGLSTSDIACALGISERAARLARDSSEPAEGAVRLDSFLDCIHDNGVEEPFAWMSEPIVDGYTATRWDLYAAGLSDLLIGNVIGTINNVEMLHRLDPDWRRVYRTWRRVHVSHP